VRKEACRAREMLNRSISWVIGTSARETIVDANDLLCIFPSLSALLLAGAADDPFLILLLKELAANHTIHVFLSDWSI